MPSSCCKHRTPATPAPAAAHCLGPGSSEAPLLLAPASAWLELPGSCACLPSPCRGVLADERSLWSSNGDYMELTWGH